MPPKMGHPQLFLASVLFRLFFIAFHLRFVNCFYILWDINISTNSTIKILILSLLLHSIHFPLSTFSSTWNFICRRTLISFLLLISPKRLSGHRENFHLYLSPAGKSSWSPHREEWKNEPGFPRAHAVNPHSLLYSYTSWKKGGEE